MKKSSKPSLEPHDIHEAAWWYEDRRGIEVYIQHSTGHGIATAHARIPWVKILRALKRCRPAAERP